MNGLKYVRFALVLMIVSSASRAQVTPRSGLSAPGGSRRYSQPHRENLRGLHPQRSRRDPRKPCHTDWQGYISLSRQIIRGADQYMQASDRVQKYAPRVGHKIIDFDALFYGDPAVVPYIAQVELNIAGATITSTLRILDVYAKLAGEWVQVASNTVVHPDAQEAFEQNPLPLNSEQKQKL
jgi:hypothetical protein